MLLIIYVCLMALCTCGIDADGVKGKQGRGRGSIWW